MVGRRLEPSLESGLNSLGEAIPGESESHTVPFVSFQNTSLRPKLRRHKTEWHGSDSSSRRGSPSRRFYHGGGSKTGNGKGSRGRDLDCGELESRGEGNYDFSDDDPNGDVDHDESRKRSRGSDRGRGRSGEGKNVEGWDMTDSYIEDASEEANQLSRAASRASGRGESRPSTRGASRGGEGLGVADWAVDDITRLDDFGGDLLDIGAEEDDGEDGKTRVGVTENAEAEVSGDKKPQMRKRSTVRRASIDYSMSQLLPHHGGRSALYRRASEVLVGALRPQDVHAEEVAAAIARAGANMKIAVAHDVFLARERAGHFYFDAFEEGHEVQPLLKPKNVARARGYEIGDTPEEERAAGISAVEEAAIVENAGGHLGMSLGNQAPSTRRASTVNNRRTSVAGGRRQSVAIRRESVASAARKASSSSARRSPETQGAAEISVSPGRRRSTVVARLRSGQGRLPLPPYESLVQMAQAEEDKGNWQGALENYTLCFGLDHDPSLDISRFESVEEAIVFASICVEKTSVYVLRQRAAIYARLGLHTQALWDLTEALKIAPQHFEAYAIRARVLLELKEYDKALMDVLMLIDFDPCPKDLQIEAFLIRAQIHRRQGEHRHCDDDLVHLTKTCPLDWRAFYRRARLYMDPAAIVAISVTPAQAEKTFIEMFSSAAKLNPHSLEIIRNLTDALLERGMEKTAILNLSDILVVDEERRHNAAQLIGSDSAPSPSGFTSPPRSPTRAAAMSTDVLSDREVAWIYTQRGRAYAADREFTKAFDDLLRSLRIWTRHAPTLFYRGAIFYLYAQHRAGKTTAKTFGMFRRGSTFATLSFDVNIAIASTDHLQAALRDLSLGER